MATSDVAPHAGAVNPSTTAHEDQFTPAPCMGMAQNCSWIEGRSTTCTCIAHSAPAGEVEPVAWMYHHADLQEYEFIKTKALRDRCKRAGYFPADAGWTETPLYTHPAPPADLAALVEALERLASTMDSYTRIGVPEYYRKLHAGYWRDEILRISTALAKHGGA